MLVGSLIGSSALIKPWRDKSHWSWVNLAFSVIHAPTPFACLCPMQPCCSAWPRHWGPGGS